MDMLLTVARQKLLVPSTPLHREARFEAHDARHGWCETPDAPDAVCPPLQTSMPRMPIAVSSSPNYSQTSVEGGGAGWEAGVC